MKLRNLTSTPVHLTYRLEGSLANQVLADLSTKYHADLEKLREQYGFPARKKSSPYYEAYQNALASLEVQHYVLYDMLLDKTTNGPMFLAGTKAKAVIINSWKFLALKHGFKLYAISVMSNHVHVVVSNSLDEELDLKPILHRHKQFTAYQLNQLQQKPGRRVWARRVFDRDIRPGKFGVVMAYVLNNPVKAGLTDSLFNWSGNYWDKKLEEELGFFERA